MKRLVGSIICFILFACSHYCLAEQLHTHERVPVSHHHHHNEDHDRQDSDPGSSPDGEHQHEHRCEITAAKLETSTVIRLFELLRYHGLLLPMREPSWFSVVLSPLSLFKGEGVFSESSSISTLIATLALAPHAPPFSTL